MNPNTTARAHSAGPLSVLSAALSAIAVGTLLALAGASPALATESGDAPVAAPQLSITISDDHDAADASDTLDYTIVVENLGTVDALGLVITQSVPEGMSFGSADSAGTLESSTVSWNLDLKVAAKASLASSMTVGKTPPQLLRLATVACVQSAPSDPPIVCASDSDLLPAGAAAAASTAHTPGPAVDSAVWWVVGGSTALGLVLAAAALVLLRRRRAVAGPSE